MTLRFKWIYVLLGLVIVIAGGRFFWPHMISGAQADHVVISEIQMTGNTPTDEFVELYNPTGSAIEMVNWRITRASETAGTINNVISSLNGTIPAYGYFLIAHEDYAGVISPDAFYSADTNIAIHNSVRLYTDAGVTLLDMVGFGDSDYFEGSGTVANPATFGSVERKATSTAILSDMLAGGVKALEGNGEDSNDNASDFVIRVRSQPQSSLVREMMADANQTALLDLTGEEETGEVTTSGSGKATVEVNTTLNRVYYVVAFQDLTGVETMAHIHGPAALGFDAPALTPLPNGFDKQGEWQYTDELEADILAGLTYINIHTFTYPDGELRGQIVFEDGVVPTVTPTTLPAPTLTLTPSPTVTLVPTLTPSPTPQPTVTPTPTTQPTMTPTPITEPAVTPTLTPTLIPTSPPNPTPTPPSGEFHFRHLVCQTRVLHFRFFGRIIQVPYFICRLAR